MVSQSQLITYFSVSSLILWFGPNWFLGLIPGMRDTLPLADTRQGLARGENWSSRNGKSFSAFRSIPFAKPPVGDRRLKPPQPLDEEDKWSRPRDFNYNPPACMQVDKFRGLTGSEDCLYLNVFTPDLSPGTRLPVMVFIHGGGFVIGSAKTLTLGPHMLMDEDVVLVTIQYRLGPLGFLNLENEQIQGNQGLWDQRQALIWVKQNIKHFGGDPGSVTIFGESAGAMAINFHLMSPMSRGLFHRAILQSGASIGPYTRHNRRPSYYAKQLGERLGCPDRQDMLECLQALPAAAIMDQRHMFDECNMRDDLGLTFPAIWAPSVDSFLAKPFLPEDPQIIQRKGNYTDVPILLGFTEDEGLLFTTRFLVDSEYEKYFFENWETCGPINLFGLEAAFIQSEDVARSRLLLEQYGGRNSPKGVIDLLSDSVFLLGSYRLGEDLAAQGSTVYRYIFSYSGSYSLSDFISRSFLETGWLIVSGMFGFHSGSRLGACHADDLFYLFSFLPLTNILPSDADQRVSRDMVRWWTTFAATGRPGEAGWRPVNGGKIAGRQAADNGWFWMVDSLSEMRERPEVVERLQRWR